MRLPEKAASCPGAWFGEPAGRVDAGRNFRANGVKINKHQGVYIKGTHTSFVG
jgi:hypothetical protein